MPRISMDQIQDLGAKAEEDVWKLHAAIKQGRV